MKHFRIKTRRKDLKLTQSDIAQGVGVSKTSVSQWENGETAPKGKNLFTLCQVLNCDPNWLLFGDMQGTPVEKVAKIHRYPLISWDELQYWPQNKSMPNTQHYPCPIRCSMKTFVLKVEGVSMEPKFHKGDIIFVDPDATVADSKFVIARLQAHVKFKQLVIESGQYYLRALNPSWPEPLLKVDPSTDILGVVVFFGQSL